MFWVPMIAIFAIGCFLGRVKGGEFYKFLALIIITGAYSMWQFHQMGDVDLDYPLSPAMADFFGRIVLFLVIGVGSTAVTSAIRVSETKPRT